MKTTYLQSALLPVLFFAIIFLGCKKSSSNDSSGSLSSINGNWQTTVWGGPNDTARMNISGNSSSGSLTYLNTGAMTTNFSVNDVIFTNIKSLGNGTYSAVGSYRYTPSSTSVLKSTTALITLQNTTTLYIVYAEDASTGITPPQYYWYKQ